MKPFLLYGSTKNARNLKDLTFAQANFFCIIRKYSELFLLINVLWSVNSKTHLRFLTGVAA